MTNNKIIMDYGLISRSLPCNVAWKIPDGTDDVVWFPRLYPHGMWHNELADGGKKIYVYLDLMIKKLCVAVPKGKILKKQGT